MRFLLLFILFLISIKNISQEKKSIQIYRTNHPPTIDGILNDDVWQKAQEAKDFVMFRPGTGNPENENQKTVVKFCYDNEAIYVGAYLYDTDVKSIPMQFTTRDNFGQTDFLLIALNPANDGINDTQFIVMSTGTQADAKVSVANGEDFGWSAVWQSATKINHDGWVVEMKIPYSALRFSNENIQHWGLNIHRRIQSKKEQYSWNFIDKTKGRFTEYSGLMQGISDIDAPVRLSFYPYTQGSYTEFVGKTEWNGNVGMDIKYGINDSFTLDATLIPDFKQTAADDVVLNLGPFEQQYEEKRAFFTEGTELFAKGDLIYSRRIGGTPMYHYDVDNQLNENEIVIDNPISTQLLNAIKFSGRTKNGLGIGIFNAITNTTKAKIVNELTNETRTIVTNPFSNYNAFVLDQQFNKTSSISLVNSNVWRQGNTSDANVSSLLSNIRINKNKYNIATDFSLSNNFGIENNKSGFQGSFNFNKIQGKNRWGYGAELSDKQYNKNDFGLQNFNNFINYFVNYSYRIFEPKGNINSLSFFVNMGVENKYKPYTYSSNYINLRLNMTNKKELSYGGGVNFQIGTEKDFYEPRVENRYFINHPYNNLYTWISTDYRKKFAIDATFSYGTQIGIDNPDHGPFIKLSPRYRFTDKFQMVYSFRHGLHVNDRGYVTIDDDDIIFGRRSVKTYVNNLNGSYNFSTKAALNLSVRHYWSPIKYKDFYTLTENGTLAASQYNQNHNINFNAWNMDTSFTWEFAPGSQFIVLYRNSISNFSNILNYSIGKNFKDLFDAPAENQVSAKLVYYIDYNKLKT